MGDFIALCAVVIAGFHRSCGASTLTAFGSMAVAPSYAWTGLSTKIQKRLHGSGCRLLNTKQPDNDLAPEFSSAGRALALNRNIRWAIGWTSSTTRETHRALCSIIGPDTSSLRS